MNGDGHTGGGQADCESMSEVLEQWTVRPSQHSQQGERASNGHDGNS